MTDHDDALRQIFVQFDTDGSGTVDVKELKAMTLALHLQLTDAELDSMMKDADPDSSGGICFEEFKLAINHFEGGVSKMFTTLKSVFDSFDEDKSGKISTQELGAMCSKLGLGLDEEGLAKLMKDADPDGSGEIDFGEFVVTVGAQMEHGGGFAQAYKKAAALVAEAEEAGASWVHGLDLLLAAAKLARARKPARRAFPGAPTNGSYDIAAEAGTPGDADCWERSRDQVLDYFVRMNTLFLVLAILSGLCLVGFGVTIAIMMLSAIFDVKLLGLTDIEEKCASYEHTCELYVAQHPGANCSLLEYEPATFNMVDRINGEGMHGSCTEGQKWFNICIKVFTIIFSYINLLPVPWRIAILVDAISPKHREWDGVKAPDDAVGVDFYGRQTEAMWFHLPIAARRNIAICLNIGWVAHYASLGAHLAYWKYWRTQVMPGLIAVNLPFIVSIIFPIIGGCIQGGAEAKVISANPKRFPPTFNAYLAKAWEKYKEELAEGNPTDPTSLCARLCRLGFIKHVREAHAEMRREQEEYEAMVGFEQASMTGIVMTEGAKSPRKPAKKQESDTAVCVPAQVEVEVRTDKV
mmetsp:Transcript_8109/g.21196  ORF Transcript_8109/g.21196 Transcript_8109/m.21196 type:complete len:580 (+) Transcript_8109:72-1811(+)